VRLPIVAVGLVAAVLGFTATARADAASAPPDGDEGKSPWIAAALAGGTALVGYGTAVGLAVGTDFEPEQVFFGAVALGLLGPAAGHIYAGVNAQHPIAFGAARLGFVAVGFIGFADLMVNDDGQVANLKPHTVLDVTLIGVAIAGVLGSTIWETIDSYACAKATHGQPRKVALAPFLRPPHGGGFGSGGLLLSGQF
jgi:hypothetical protein